MSEMVLTADHLIVIRKGELIADVGVQELVRGASSSAERVRDLDTELIEIHGAEAEDIGEAALGSGIVLHELAPRQASLEDAFMELTGESLEFRAGDAAGNVADDALVVLPPPDPSGVPVRRLVERAALRWGVATAGRTT